MAVGPVSRWRRLSSTLSSGVQGGEGLVQEEHPGLAGQGPGQGHPLLLPSRERLGVAALEAGEVHHLQKLQDPLPDLFRRKPPEP
jgi:hypothetical protein